ncbi:hypothetical protein [Saccharothrix luteola]|uniref:hypothetical protein n=1 Tax=Saccharothrix luteola TaxID=2893018 RepID=UPI001E3CA057|nr:hypothetical protein [Saccharothrix luteola]MCC8246962.1 hypothetical protein [Saccharothrix luteola]
MNFVVRRPGQPFAEYMTAVFAGLIADLRRDGVEPGRVRLDVDVTDRSDEEILLTLCSPKMSSVQVRRRGGTRRGCRPVVAVGGCRVG